MIYVGRNVEPLFSFSHSFEDKDNHQKKIDTSEVEMKENQ